MHVHHTHTHTHTHTQLPNGTNGLNEELIGFSEAGCSPSESFKFLGSVKSSQREDEDRHREGERGKKNGWRETVFKPSVALSAAIAHNKTHR